MARSFPAVLLVDGYNIIGTWPALKNTCTQAGLEAARWELTQVLTGFSAFQGFKTQLIFDAQYQRNSTTCEIVTQNLAVYYTEFGQTADTHIERICALHCRRSRKGHERMIVATSDRAQQLTVIGYGAEWKSAQQLADEVASTAGLVRQSQKNLKKTPHSYLGNSLDPVAKKRLERLRMGLS